MQQELLYLFIYIILLHRDIFNFDQNISSLTCKTHHAKTQLVVIGM